MDCVDFFQVNSTVETKGCDFLGILMHDVTSWIIRTTDIVMCGENFKDGSVLVCWFVLVLHFNSRTKFP